MPDNNATGSIYCKSTILEPIDHAVTIIGWDDNYSKDNFNTNQQPTTNGAWIIKNSWGESQTESLTKLKEEIFNANQTSCINNGWNSASEIPTEKILEILKNKYGESKVTVDGDNVTVELGNKGYMYVSYEDCNVYTSLSGIQKATSSKDYYSIYQNDILGPTNAISVSTSQPVYVANVFSRDSSIKEALNKVSVYTTQGYTCKVFVNPNGSSKSINDLQEAKLSEGETATFEAGYHTIEFAEPITLTGNSFVVVIEILNDNYSKQIALESKIADTVAADVVVNPGESFYTSEDYIKNNVWVDFTTLDEDKQGNVCIKAFTTEKEEDKPDVTTEEEKTPTSSNFDNTKSVITESKLYFKSEDIKNASGEITIKVSGIKVEDENSKHTYYYYISGTQGDNNITNWKESQITKEDDGTYSMTINVKSSEISNNDINETDNLYIYIKEIVQASEKRIEKIVTMQIDNQSETICYVDNKKIGTIEDLLKYNSSNNAGNGSETTNKETDNTKAKGILPNAGIATFGIIFAIIIIAFGVFTFHRYKNIDR